MIDTSGNHARPVCGSVTEMHQKEKKNVALIKLLNFAAVVFNVILVKS